jgi:hypothetical protein
MEGSIPIQSRATPASYEGQMQKNRKESKKRRNAWLREMRPYSSRDCVKCVPEDTDRVRSAESISAVQVIKFLFLDTSFRKTPDNLALPFETPRIPTSELLSQLFVGKNSSYPNHLF